MLGYSEEKQMTGRGQRDPRVPIRPPGPHDHTADPSVSSGSFSEPLWAKEALNKSANKVRACVRGA